MTEVWVLMIVGSNEEPFLEAALRSVDWVDGYAVVNTAPDDSNAAQNEATVRRIVPAEKLRLERLRMATFDFARARNTALGLIPQNAYALIVDADDVHHEPEFSDQAREAIAAGHEVIGAHFWHHVYTKDLWHSQPFRRILFRNEPGVRFENTAGHVHEELRWPGRIPEVRLLDYCYNHYGMIQPARTVARKWEFYRSLGAEVHDYDVEHPDRALDDWPRICHLYSGEHPEAVRGILADYPECPTGVVGRDLRASTATSAPKVGLVLLTWDDAANLRKCLRTLRHTIEPFRLFVVDNGSTDETLTLLDEAADFYGDRFVRFVAPGKSLAEALNLGFREALADLTLDYVGWIHPDMTFDWPNWLGELVTAMGEHPEWAKLGASEAQVRQPSPHPGNSQAYIIRRSALEKVGLFDERMVKCGGYEDWLMNWRLIQEGWKVMIWPDAIIRHEAMSTRKRHDNVDAARQNADTYYSVTGTWDPPC